ncbi:hypothetical protein MBLNU459_g4891t1 [Dothideomycetes sp. NU459]
MPSSHVLRVRRTDADYVLVSVYQNGLSPLDLKLVGTDGNDPFVAEIKHADIAKFQDKNHQASPDEWTDCLSAVLLRQPSDSPAVVGIEILANVANEQITLLVRKNISGITQRLGTISLVLNEDEAIELFDWAGSAACASENLRVQLVDLQSSLSSRQQEIVRLTAQLDDLVQAKKEHEQMLLTKFAALLNSKKMKIRDQQRLLAHAKIDPKAAEQVQQTRSTSTRKPSSSRPSKRKASGRLAGSDDDDNEGSELGEPSDMDGEMGNAATPENSDLDDTQDEDSDADEFEPAPIHSQALRSALGSSRAETETTKSKGTLSETGQAEVVPEPPPRRELPFGRKPQSRPVSAVRNSTMTSRVVESQPAVGEDEEETTDDEL